MSLNLIKEIVTGSITGYITNAIAVKMIFREYGVGKLKLGGIVKKTRNEFIHNISSVVEKDIINHKTLSSELNKEDFKQSIEKFVDDLINIHVKENMLNLSLEDIDGFDSTVSNAESYVKHCSSEYIPNVFNIICKNIHLKDLINENQIEYISEELVKKLTNTLSNSDFIERTIEDFYNENKNVNFGEFFGDKLFKVIGENIEKESTDLHLKLKSKFNHNIDDTFEKTIKVLKIHEILNELEKELSEKRIIDFIGSEGGINLSKDLLQKIKKFIESEEGKEVVNDFSIQVFNILKNIDISILDLLSNNLQENLDEFFKDKLQYSVKEVILWIEKNKENIEALIEKSIDNTVESMDDSAKKEIINSIRDRFLNDVGNKFNLVAKITEYLNNNTDIDSISGDVTFKIIKYIKEESISTIIKKLNQNNIFTEESFSNFVSYNLTKYLDHIPEDYFYKFLNKKIKDICSINLVNIFENHIKEPFFNIIKNKYIYTEGFTEYITKNIIQNLKDVKNLNIEEILNKEQVDLNGIAIKKVVLDKLQSNKIHIVQGICSEFNIFLQGVTLDKALGNDLRKKILSEGINTSFDKISETLDYYKSMQLKDVFEKVNKIENINEVLAESIIVSLKSNLNYILENNIKSIVSSNLSGLKDEELQDMVEQFMGKEMKPITVIGAMLGGIIGIGTYFLDASTVQLNYYSSTLINVVVYALVGWITNVQAVAMLFKPYTEKRFLSVKVPFTPGVIVSRKPKFAKSMSAFVDEELLNKHSMEKMFDKNEQHIYNKFKEKLSKDNYKVIADLLNKNSNNISSKSCYYGKKFIANNKRSISQSLADKLKGFNMTNVDFSKVDERVTKEILEKIKSSYIILADHIIKELEKNKEISAVCPDELKALIKKKLDCKFEQELNNLLACDKELNKENLNLILSSKYENLCEKSIRELISVEYIEKYKKYLNNQVISKINSQEARENIFNLIEKTILKYMNPTKKIEELFGGFFIKIVKDNLSYIMDNTVKSIVKGVSNNQQVIAEVAITTTKENLNFFEVIGYNMLGGDEIISAIVDNFVNQQLPGFMEEKKDELNEILEGFIDTRICGSSLDELNINIESEAVLSVLSGFLSNENNQEVLKVNISNVTDRFIDVIAQVKLEEYMNILSIKQSNELTAMFNDEIKFIEKSIKNNISISKDTLVKEYSKLGYDIFEGLILSQKISKFTDGIDRENIEKICSSISCAAYNSKSVNQNCVSFIKQFINTDIKDKKLEQLVNIEEFNASTEIVLHQLIDNKEICKVTRKAIEDIIKDIIASDCSILNKDTKGFVVNLAVNSIKDSLKENFPSIIKSIDFKAITEKEINNMDPREIELLFNSFAGKYFDKLKLYGLGGAVFGLHWMVGVASFIAYTASSIKEN